MTVTATRIQTVTPTATTVSNDLTAVNRTALGVGLGIGIPLLITLMVVAILMLRRSRRDLPPPPPPYVWEPPLDFITPRELEHCQKPATSTSSQLGSTEHPIELAAIRQSVFGIGSGAELDGSDRAGEMA